MCCSFCCVVSLHALLFLLLFALLYSGCVLYTPASAPLFDNRTLPAHQFLILFLTFDTQNAIADSEPILRRLSLTTPLGLSRTIGI